MNLKNEVIKGGDRAGEARPPGKGGGEGKPQRAEGIQMRRGQGKRELLKGWKRFKGKSERGERTQEKGSKYAQNANLNILDGKRPPWPAVARVRRDRRPRGAGKGARRQGFKGKRNRGEKDPVKDQNAQNANLKKMDEKKPPRRRSR